MLDSMCEIVEWIAIVDELPDELEHVLLYSAGAARDARECMIVCEGYLDCADGWMTAEGVAAACVTHWAPLPEGPLTCQPRLA